MCMNLSPNKLNTIYMKGVGDPADLPPKSSAAKINQMFIWRVLLHPYTEHLRNSMTHSCLVVQIPFRE